MDLLILLLYSLFCWIIFKVFKVPVNKWTLTTSFLGGIIFIVSIMLLMNYNHPYTSNARTYFVSTPIITNVSSQVESVQVIAQQKVKKGDTLFILDNTVFVSKLNSLEADLKLAKTRLSQSRRLFKARAGSRYDVQMYQAEIEKIEAVIEEAKWKVNQCVITAKSTGMIGHMRLRPGMRAVEFPLKPLMTFIDTDRQFVIAAMPQNPLQQMEIGNEAEVIFDAVPGKIFKGKVSKIGEVIAQGELQTKGTLHNFDSTLPHGYIPQGSVPFMIELEDDISAFRIPGGAKSQVAIYSHHMEPVKVVRKVLLRMKGWLNYVFGEH
jgi:multidrug resistance efflux pump